MLRAVPWAANVALVLVCLASCTEKSTALRLRPEWTVGQTWTVEQRFPPGESHTGRPFPEHLTWASYEVQRVDIFGATTIVATVKGYPGRTELRFDRDGSLTTIDGHSAADQGGFATWNGGYSESDGPLCVDWPAFPLRPKREFADGYWSGTTTAREVGDRTFVDFRRRAENDVEIRKHTYELNWHDRDPWWSTTRVSWDDPGGHQGHVDGYSTRLVDGPPEDEK